MDARAGRPSLKREAAQDSPLGLGSMARAKGPVDACGPRAHRRVRQPIALFMLAVALLAPSLLGCRSKGEFRFDESRFDYETVATQIEYPDAGIAASEELLQVPPPHTVASNQPPTPWPLSLDETIHIALANSQIVRDAGGRVARTPESVPSIYDPAIQETDPRSGPEAALSAFDAQFTTGIFWERNNRATQNLLTGGFGGLGNFGFLQDRAAFAAEIRKQAATGTEFALGNETTYDMNNRIFNLSDVAYDTIFTAELRHPLLQGSGIEFNRIAGPNALPGQYRGVVISRINTDISLAEFQAAVRDLLFEVERAYWELYFSYRDLDAKTAGRNAALETWRSVYRKYQAGSADEEQEALAREQYYLFDALVINALGGREAAGGVAGLGGGVYAAERHLRNLVGLPANDGRLIRPADEPSTAHTVFDWSTSLEEALWRRVELQRQLWLVKRRELELVASRNFLRMRLDFVGEYRWRGLGNPLVGDGSAFEQLLVDDYEEWQMGLQLSTPVGNRIGHTAVRNAELLLCREKARYREIERQVVTDASSAFAELDRTHAVCRANFNRAEAARRQLSEIKKKLEAGWEKTPLQFYIDAQARTTEADSIYFRSLVDYNLAVVGVHRATGTLLSHYQVHLAEGPWSQAAYLSAKKQARRFAPKLLNYSFTRPCPITVGAFPQGTVIDPPMPVEPTYEAPATDRDEPAMLPAPLPNSRVPS